MKVFLGGTCNETDWRDKLIQSLQIEYFNPVITDRDWTEEDRQNEIQQRQECDYVLFVITPRLSGFYSIAEVVDDSNKKPEKTIFYVQPRDTNDQGQSVVFNPAVRKSMDAIIELVKKNGAHVMNSLEEIATFLNSKKD